MIHDVFVFKSVKLIRKRRKRSSKHKQKQKCWQINGIKKWSVNFYCERFRPSCCWFWKFLWSLSVEMIIKGWT